MKILKKWKKAFTLVELLLVVGIIALGSTVAYITYSKVSISSKTRDEKTRIQTLMASAENWRGLGRTYWGWNFISLMANKEFNAMRTVPPLKDMYQQETLVNAFGAQLYPGATCEGGCNAVTGGKGYLIHTVDIPTASCIELVTTLAPQLTAVWVVPTMGSPNGGYLGSVPGFGAHPSCSALAYLKGTPLNPQRIIEKCGEADVVTIGFFKTSSPPACQ